MDGGLTFSSAPGRWVIAATVLGSGIAMIDSTVVGIALRSIGRGFHTPLGPLQWVVTGYTLTLGAFLLLGGSLGDGYGRKRVFMIGVAWFAVASALCGFAPDPEVLVLTRCLQGVGGALLTPGSLAILQASFTREDRARAIGAWSGLGGLAAAAGPVLGGYLVSAASWRWIFFINVPISAFVLVVCARHVPESYDRSATKKVDVPGAALGVVALACATYTLIEGSAQGWDTAAVLGCAAVAVVASIGFLLAERAVPAPMLPLDIFRSRQFSATNVVTFAVYGALGGAFFLIPLALQGVSRYSPLESGVALIPITIIMLLFSARSGRLATRIGPRLQMSLGPVVVAAGLALLTRAVSGTEYFEYVFPAVVVFGVGLAIVVAPLTATAMDSAPSEHAGIASAVNNDVARVAGLVAVAILPWLAGLEGRSYLNARALASEFRTAVLIAAALCATGGVLAAVAIRNPSPSGGGDEAPLPAGPAPEVEPATYCFHCALDAPPIGSAERA